MGDPRTGYAAPKIDCPSLGKYLFWSRLKRNIRRTTKPGKESNMYVSIRRYKTNRAAELTRKVKEEFVALISKAPGFVAYYGIEAGTDTWASISIFDTQAQAEESNRLAADWVKKSVASLVAGTPEVTAGNAVVQKTK
jgi:hypothetical protein